MQSSNEVWQAITSAGLGTADDCRRWAAEVAAKVPPEHLASGTRTLEALVIRGHLTEYQATALRDGNDDLRVGNWILERPVGSGVWSDWFEATDRSTQAWIRVATSSQLDRLRLYRPSVRRAQKLAELDLPGCQRIVGVETDRGRLLTAVAPLGKGKWLTQAATQKPEGSETPEKRVKLWAEIVECVCQLHQNAIAHGALAPDRVWMEAGSPILVTDPLCERSAMPSSSASGLIRRELDDLLPEHFIAPEFLAPDPSPSFAADVFSLGCIGWWLLTGRAPADAGSSEQVMAAQAKPFLSAAEISLPGGPAVSEAVGRVLLHAMSRNISGRFANALQLRTALSTALELSADNVASPKRELAKDPIPTPIDQSLAPEPKPVTEQPTEKTPPKPKQCTKTKKPPARAKTPQTPPANSPVSHKSDQPERKPAAISQEATGSQQGKDETASARPARKQPTPEKRAEKPVEKPVETATDPADELSVEPKSPKVEPPAATKNRSSNEPAKNFNKNKNPSKTTGRKSGNKLLVPIMGGCGFLIIMLAILKLSGALETSGSRKESQRKVAPYQPKKDENVPVASGSAPESTKFTVVSDDDRLWLPPAERTVPIPADLLPPGSQVLASVRPGWLAAPNEHLAGALANAAERLAKLVVEHTGVELGELAQVTLALYPPEQPGGPPQIALRALLKRPMAASQLSKLWEAPAAKLDGLDVFASDELLYLLDADADQEAVRQFACGPIMLMREAAELGGQAAPMTPPVEQLWRLSDATADLSLLAAPQFFFADGRWLIEQLPERLSGELRRLLANDRRSVLFQSRLAPTWYGELALTGRDQSSAAGIVQQLRERLAAWPERVESWFADEAPHAAWRAIALRLPQMLRMLGDNARTGVEDGVAKLNFYLPEDALPNLTLATWLASQDGATMIGSGNSVAAVKQPLTIEEYLGRPIRLSFAQEPIEVALRLVADEANDNLPAGTPQLKFELDGDAFELAGITRNQQLSDFDVGGLPVRDALTEIARRGNPITTVTDTRQEDQQLIWVVRPDPNGTSGQMISLTTRTAAAARNDTLPVEFAP